MRSVNGRLKRQLDVRWRRFATLGLQRGGGLMGVKAIAQALATGSIGIVYFRWKIRIQVDLHRIYN
jgi:hypothetical protein